jgi:hypothetical protein
MKRKGLAIGIVLLFVCSKLLKSCKTKKIRSDTGTVSKK